MEQFLNIFLPILIITILSVLYVWFLLSRQSSSAKKNQQDDKESLKQNMPKRATVVPFMDSKLLRFYEVLKAALPSNFIIYPNVAVEKLFEVAKRRDLRMQGQYADFVVFSPTEMPILVIDLFDMSIINLDQVNKIKNISKDILRNSGIPVLDYKYNEVYNIDELRRLIANLLNPLRVDKK